MLTKKNEFFRHACCPELVRNISDPEAGFDCDLSVLHFFTHFAVPAYRDSNQSCAIDNRLSFCLWCGSQFPNSTESSLIDKKNNKFEDFCSTLKTELFYNFDCPDHPKIRCSTFPISYEIEKRRFLISSVPSAFLLHKVYEQDNQKYRVLINQIFFCPWCGSRLPKSLAKEWFEIVREKFGITDLSDYKAISKLPKKYLTEEWWREKGL